MGEKSPDLSTVNLCRSTHKPQAHTHAVVPLHPCPVVIAVGGALPVHLNELREAGRPVLHRVAASTEEALQVLEALRHRLGLPPGMTRRASVSSSSHHYHHISSSISR
jgi:hypothetical protein